VAAKYRRTVALVHVCLILFFQLSVMCKWIGSLLLVGSDEDPDFALPTTCFLSLCDGVYF